MQEFVIYDTEFTAWAGSKERQWSEPWEHREIIQLAAVKVQILDNALKIIESFNELVIPSINPQLSDYISKLTGIEQNTLHNLGVDFPSVLKQFWQFCGNGQLPAFSWGDDAKILRENCQLTNTAFPSFALGLFDIKERLQQQNINFPNTYSGQLAASLGIQLNGKEHNALHDVRSITAALQYWIEHAGLQLSRLLNSPH
ncbi:3'-5' exonuclease [Alteromonas sp. a30]|uniref:3'-5' exonuclease n=1 Tax=Alteromonas sp. a30 TaxID=2730917 RepID=UPI00228175AA|nr:3'-5' exonuclease [Alteromonas sp. a30]MCY7295683.1 exonuclease domain-containing protein [Alteromonas sp. a30]